MKKLNTSTWIAAISGLLVIVAAVAIVVLLRRGTSDAQAEPSATQQQEAPSKSGLAAADLNGDGIVYQSGMHPWIVEDEPGQCPICGMDMVPVRVDEISDGSIRIDPVTLQNTGVRTAPVQVEALQNMVRTTGRFEANEQQLAAVSPKISGWIEKLHVNYEGARVAKGQPLLEIYSPELVSTQEEYLLALRNQQRLDGSPAAMDAERLVAAARRRLAYWDITDSQIRRLEETKQPEKTLTLYAPASGTVVATRAVEGQRVTAGESLMQLSNLSSLWLMVDVYEQNLSWVEVGTEAVIELPYQPGTSTRGRVNYLYDHLDPETRSLKARISVPNPGLKLKPGMYATVTLTGQGSSAMPVVPAEAVVRTGGRVVVILALGEGRFLPANVVTGVQSGDRVQVLSGLQGNETVVTSAQFLIDSEARLQSVIGGMMAGRDAAGPASGDAGSTPSDGGMPDPSGSSSAGEATPPNSQAGH